MKWNNVERHWKDFEGGVKSTWDKLTTEDLAVIAGKRSMLVTKLQERYGILEFHANCAVDVWLSALGPHDDGEVRRPTQSLLDEQRAADEGMGHATYAPPDSHAAERQRLANQNATPTSRRRTS
jgi:uncharacterized protein YjbJ (UPF0337 family)